MYSVHPVYKIARCSRPENTDRGRQDVAKNMGHYYVIIHFIITILLLLLLCIFSTSAKEARSVHVGGRVVLRRGRDSGGARAQRPIVHANAEQCRRR